MTYFYVVPVVFFILMVALTVFVTTNNPIMNDVSDKVFVYFCGFWIVLVASLVWPLTILVATAFGVGYWIKEAYLKEEE